MFFIAPPPDKKPSRRIKKLTNDELLYDPDMDDEDERWVQRQRMAYHNGKEWTLFAI